jgi:hypothetical protein
VEKGKLVGVLTIKDLIDALFYMAHAAAAVPAAL